MREVIVLKPCPFLKCGGRAKIKKYVNYDITHYIVECEKCGCSPGDPKRYLKSAINWWNRREIMKEVRELREKLAKLAHEQWSG